MKPLIHLAIILILLMVAGLVSAQEADLYPLEEAIPAGVNDPRFNENANACYIGGTMSGKCNNTDVNDDNVIDDFDRDWMWTAGWHRIRYDFGLTPSDSFDNAYETVLPEDAVRPIDSMSAGCYELIFEGEPERYILWPGGNNAQMIQLFFRDTCEGPFFFFENVVAAETYEAADLICKRDLGKHLYAERFASSFYYCVYYRPDFTTYPPAPSSTGE